jgi:hypothetical protein
VTFSQHFTFPFSPRLDWCTDNGNQFAVFRMVTKLHDCVGGWFAKQTPAIQRALRALARCGRPLLRPLHSGAFSVADGTMGPDEQIDVILEFEQPNGEYLQVLIPHPRVVLETCFSQSMEDAVKKAWRYLYLSDSQCQAVVICDMTYPPYEPGKFKAVMSVWVREKTGDIGERLYSWPMRLR